MNGRNQPQAYLNHVAMIQSKIEPNSPVYKRVQLPATIFNRSPLRERFGPAKGNEGNINTNNANPRLSPSKKTGLSPLRSRRMQNNAPVPSITRVTSREREQMAKQPMRRGFCQNHQSKPASFFVQSNTESGEYCEKCAILLASQGFKVTRLEDNRPTKLLTSGQEQLAIDNPTRRLEMNRFLEDLKHIGQLVRSKKSEVEDQLAQSHRHYQQQEQLINDYYKTLMMCIEEHKNKTLEGLVFARSSSEMPAVQLSQMFDQSLSQCQEMRSDIYSSVKAINAVDEKSFRPVMDTYKERAERLYREMNGLEHEPLNHSQLIMNDPREVTRGILGMIEITFIQRQPTQPSLREKKNSVYFSFENQQRLQEQLYSDQKQEMIQTQDKQTALMVSNGAPLNSDHHDDD